MSVKEKILFYWKSTAHELEWTIAYRFRNKESTLITELDSKFKIVELPDGYWGADPLPIEYNGKLFLFFELFRKKDNKGLIACSIFDGKNFTNPKVILEESCHLSFPFVFKINSEFYMIPETGGRRTVELYKCTEFPYNWKREKVLLNDVRSSDTVVFEINENLYVLASMLTSNNACEAQNTLFSLDRSDLSLTQLLSTNSIGSHGIRNAGPLFYTNGKVYRPGQNCDGKQYGKSLILFEIDEANDSEYCEHEIKDVNVNDIAINQTAEKYDGIHTYTVTDHYEFIDLKSVVRHSIIKRIALMLRYAEDIVLHKFRKIE